jgi:hypothetical protein
MRRARLCLLLFVLAVVVAASAGDEEEQKVAKQPVDLHAAQALNTVEDPKQLESLLHWAIGKHDDAVTPATTGAMQSAWSKSKHQCCCLCAAHGCLQLQASQCFHDKQQLSIGRYIHSSH